MMIGKYGLYELKLVNFNQLHHIVFFAYIVTNHYAFLLIFLTRIQAVAIIKPA